MQEHILERLHREGFTDIDPSYLIVVQYPGPQGERPSDLAARLRISKQALNHLLGQLEQLGYLERRPDPDDKRSKRIAVTPRGVKAGITVREAVADMEATWSRQLGPKRFSQLRTLLRELNQRPETLQPVARGRAPAVARAARHGAAEYAHSVVSYTETAEGIRAEQLAGFFVDWPVRPTAERHLDLLRGSHAVALALDGNQVVGFATATSDGVLSAFIPLLEVLPAYQRHGIGTELVRRLLGQLESLYMVDVCCDANVEPFYARLGFQTLDRGMGLRRRRNI